MFSKSRVAAAAVGLLACVGVVSNAAAITVTGVVPNRFERSCWWGCSPYKQANGPYVSSVPSVCVTHGWAGTKTYTLPPRDKC